ncbi:Uncharacterised protein [Mycoplasmopsis bovirhinis]|uniref:Type I restriction modification DNA specificity domain-containing protein n=1 Tax=Mycoplasmopsis bovirhinis TaxID=29553 RepID=A0A449AE46_9BACT|nr:Uncharacterised protein [Mycoplasmopsis bovirhinis]
MGSVYNILIVNTIGSVDDLIEKKQEIILKIKEYRRIKFMKYASLSNLEEDILEHIELENGSQPPKEQHVYELMPGYVRFVQNRDYSSDVHLTYIPISKRNHLCSISDIMMDKYGDAGAIRYGIVGAFNVALFKIIPKNFYEIEYIRDFLSQKKIKDLLYLSSQASTRPSLNEKTFIGIKMPLLSKDILFKYQESMENILNIELKIKNEIEKLKQIKQHLLNKYF